MFDRLTNKIQKLGQNSSERGGSERFGSERGHGEHGFVSAVYFSNWSIYERKHFPRDIDYNCVTHVFYAFLKIDTSSGSVGFSDPWADIDVPLPFGDHKINGVVNHFKQLKNQYPHLKVVFSIGGWGTDHAFEAVVKDSRKLDKFINSSVEIVAKHGFDGIDIDWEYPKGKAQGNSFCSILEGLRRGLDGLRPGMILSAALSGVEENVACLDIHRMIRVLDLWNLMCYDFTGNGWSDRTGFHSNLFGNNGDNDINADSMVKLYIRKGVPSHKIVVGMPLYGRKFAGVSKPEIGQRFDKSAITDEGIVEFNLLPLKGTTEQFDQRKVGAYCYDKCGTFITYDNVSSVRVKAAYCVSNKLGGGFFWDSAGDKKNQLVREFYGVLKERS